MKRHFAPDQHGRGPIWLRLTALILAALMLGACAYVLIVAFTLIATN